MRSRLRSQSKAQLRARARAWAGAVTVLVLVLGLVDEVYVALLRVNLSVCLAGSRLGRFGAVLGEGRYRCPILARMMRRGAAYPVPGT